MLERVQRVLLAILLVILLTIVTLSAYVFWSWGQPAGPTPVETFPPELADESSPTAVPIETVLPTLTQSLPLPVSTTTSDPSSLKIGIVAGHWPDDSGAVCPDGLTEVEINLAVAQQVVASLTRAGYSAEVLAEFSPSLDGYQATALVSIHSDSCNVPEATGFKVARVTSSLVPELEDRLVACLIDKYQSATDLRFHRNSITYDMKEYHALYEIAPETPAAIIEIGFLDADRRLLTRRQDRVVRGIVDGIECFVASTR
jgi:N-acetylmuramoyl-L-alanine amidase